jgi:hypothetical protein
MKYAETKKRKTESEKEKIKKLNRLNKKVNIKGKK